MMPGPLNSSRSCESPKHCNIPIALAPPACLGGRDLAPQMTHMTQTAQIPPGWHPHHPSLPLVLLLLLQVLHALWL